MGRKEMWNRKILGEKKVNQSWFFEKITKLINLPRVWGRRTKKRISKLHKIRDERKTLKYIKRGWKNSATGLTEIKIIMRKNYDIN